VITWTFVRWLDGNTEFDGSINQYPIKETEKFHHNMKNGHWYTVILHTTSEEFETSPYYIYSEELTKNIKTDVQGKLCVFNCTYEIFQFIYGRVRGKGQPIHRYWMFFKLI